MNVSLLVGLKNNLEYTINFYSTTRELYPTAEIVFVSYGSKDGTHQWLDNLRDSNLRYHYLDEEKSLSDTYNTCISLATKDYVAFLHNDMILGSGFVESLCEEVAANKILFYKVVEPPIFSEDMHDWKIVKDFGTDLDTFQLEEFRSYCGSIEKRSNTETRDQSFFLVTSRKALAAINGLDPLFNPMFREDDDLLYRLHLYGLIPYQSQNALVYHFVSKTSRFSEEYQHKTKLIETQSDRNFYRKWGFGISSVCRDKRQYGLVLKNADENAVRILEPFVSKIYTDFNVANYIKNDQPSTLMDLQSKFSSQNTEKLEDVLIVFDARSLNASNLKKFSNLADEIDKKSKSSWVRFKRKYLGINGISIGDLKLTIFNLKTYQHNLIVRK